MSNESCPPNSKITLGQVDGNFVVARLVEIDVPVRLWSELYHQPGFAGAQGVLQTLVNYRTASAFKIFSK